MRITTRMAARPGMMALGIAVAVSTASAQQGDEGAIRMLSNKWQQDIAKQADAQLEIRIHHLDGNAETVVPGLA